MVVEIVANGRESGIVYIMWIKGRRSSGDGIGDG